MDEFGTMDDFDRLLAKAHELGLKIVIDLVVNHTSDSHPMFKAACDYIRAHGEPGGEYGDYYNFTTTKNLGGYSSVSGTSYYYESRFWSGMPDLNLNSQNVRNMISDVMRYWLVDHNVDGFRLDAVTSYYTGDVNKNVDFLSWLNTTAKSFKPDAYIVGEAWEGNDVIIDRYYDSGCDSFFLFTGAQATGTIATLVKQSSGASLGKLLTNLQNTYTNGVLAPFLGNHDTMRPGSFMPGIENLKMAAGVLSMMNGSVFVYYGEEIGMISKNGSNSDPAKRIAMKWSDKGVYEGWCYISPEGTPVDESSYYYPSVEAQKEDKGSILNYYKQAMRLRNSFPSIARGEVEYFPDGQNNYICVITKTYGEEKITIVFNMDTFEQTVTLDTGLVPANKIVGELYSDISTKASLNGTKLVMPPQSIVILQ
jgi:glycosidase